MLCLHPNHVSRIDCAGNGMHVKRTFNNLIKRVGDVVECWYTSQFYNLINATSSGATKIGGTGKYESPLRFRITDKNSSLEFRFKKNKNAKRTENKKKSVLFFLFLFCLAFVY